MKKRVEGRRKTVEEIIARYCFPACLRHETRPYMAGNLSRLPAYVFPVFQKTRRRHDFEQKGKKGFVISKPDIS